MANKTISIFHHLRNLLLSSQTIMSFKNTKPLYFYLILLLMSLLFAFASCNPAYKVIHHGYGVYTDTISVRYSSGNVSLDTPF